MMDNLGEKLELILVRFKQNDKSLQQTKQELISLINTQISKGERMIKHMALAWARTEAEQEWYLCNQAIKPNPDKLVYQWDKVTCKNCLRQRTK